MTRSLDQEDELMDLAWRSIAPSELAGRPGMKRAPNGALSLYQRLLRATVLFDSLRSLPDVVPVTFF